LVSNLVGGAIGAITEYGGQVLTNIASKGLNNDAFTNVDYGDIAIAATEGFVTSGGSVIKSALTKGATHIASTIIKNSINTTSDGIKIEDARTALDNITIDLASGGAKFKLNRINVFRTKTASKAIREVRRKLASRGERLSSEKARAIAGKTRANNLIKREVNSIITEETNTAFSKVGSSIVKGRRNKNE